VWYVGDIERGGGGLFAKEMDEMLNKEETKRKCGNMRK
jgi:hypothetical protein